MPGCSREEQTKAGERLTQEGKRQCVRAHKMNQTARNTLSLLFTLCLHVQRILRGGRAHAFYAEDPRFSPLAGLGRTTGCLAAAALSERVPC